MDNIIPIISGKGGVGKSTVAVNVAVALAKRGAKVALIDSDFYGPSIPTLMGGGEAVPDHEGRLLPAEKFGVKYVSLGFFLSNPDDPVIWRGPMFNKALQQLFSDVNWGQVDYCIVDMPPGTGDAQISITQMVQVKGSVVVTTPQEVALSDVRKAINMMRKVNVEVFSIVENMAGFVDSAGKRHDIFGSGGGESLAKAFDIPLIASVPIHPAIREGGDKGEPIAASGEGELAEVFNVIAENIETCVERVNKNSQSVQVVN